MLDLAVTGGVLVDGSGAPARRAGIGIRDGRIACVVPVEDEVGSAALAAAPRHVDATGLVVAPGFIDIHSHSEYLLLEDGRGQSKIRQGVTTEVFGESESPGPYAGQYTPPGKTVRGRTERWSTLGEFFTLIERERVSLNVASFVDWGMSGKR